MVSCVRVQTSQEFFSTCRMTRGVHHGSNITAVWNKGNSSIGQFIYLNSVECLLWDILRLSAYAQLHVNEKVIGIFIFIIQVKSLVRIKKINRNKDKTFFSILIWLGATRWTPNWLWHLSNFSVSGLQKSNRMSAGCALTLFTDGNQTNTVKYNSLIW